jgi:hypothetical protein
MLAMIHAISQVAAGNPPQSHELRQVSPARTSRFIPELT